MSAITILGLLAGFCTTIAFIPQVRKTWRSKSTNDLSLGMISVYVTGIGLWLIYGLALGDSPLILANLVTFGLAGSVLYFKLRYG